MKYVMKKRIFRGMFLQSCLIVCLSVFIIMGMLYNYFSKITMQEIKNELTFISVGVEQNGREYLEALGDGNSRITWIAENGDIIYDSEMDESQMENHNDREEVVTALKEGSGESYRFSNTLGKMSYYYATLLDDNSVLRISGTRYTVISLLMGMVTPILIVIIIASVVSMIISIKISENITRPVNEIDLRNIDKVETYEELTPFIRKISHQNKKIQSQVNELRQKQQEFDTITENMSEGLLVFDKNTDVIFYNTSALKLLGAEEVLGKQSVYVLNRSEVFMNSVNLALKGEHSECNISLNDRIYQIIANPVYNENQLAGGIIIIVDVTEKEEREHLRREFSANVSHELKTPLTSISGFAEIMKSGMVNEEDMKKFAGNIYNEAKRLITLVGDIIKLSKFDESSEKTEFEDVDFTGIVFDNVNRLSQVAEGKNVSIIIDCDEVHLDGFSSVIDEMVYNLIENAIKYNKENGTVNVSLKHIDDKVKFIVEDTGIGIPYGEQQRVFERFYRVDKSHSKEIGGTGLGLSIVKHGAAMHNANIELISEPDKGTKIVVVF